MHRIIHLFGQRSVYPRHFRNLIQARALNAREPAKVCEQLSSPFGSYPWYVLQWRLAPLV